MLDCSNRKPYMQNSCQLLIRIIEPALSGIDADRTFDLVF